MLVHQACSPEFFFIQHAVGSSRAPVNQQISGDFGRREGVTSISFPYVDIR
jgi:hypothetical protein